MAKNQRKKVGPHGVCGVRLFQLCLCVSVTLKGPHPWILNRGWLKSSCQRPYFLNRKTQRIAFFPKKVPSIFFLYVWLFWIYFTIIYFEFFLTFPITIDFLFYIYLEYSGKLCIFGLLLKDFLVFSWFYLKLPGLLHK